MNSLSLDDPTLSPTLPTLPSELIDEILREESLSKTDLLRCCLVSHQFLLIPHQRLYSIARISICFTKKYGEISGTFQARDPTSELLLRTWRENPFLCRQVTKLHLDHDDVATENYLIRSQDVPSTLVALQVAEILNLLPRITSLKIGHRIWDSLWVQELILDRSEQWQELDVQGGSRRHEGGRFSDASLETGETIYTFPNLRNLRCGQVSVRQPWSTMFPSLERLESFTQFEGSFPTTPPPHLRVLSTLFSNIRYTTTYANLQRLHLIFDADVDLHPEFLTAFSKLARLKSFSLTMSSMHLSGDLLAHLPLTLTHLNFFAYIPFDALIRFLSPTQWIPPLLRVLGLNLVDSGVRLFARELDALKQLCQAKGIVLEDIVAGQNIFLL